MPCPIPRWTGTGASVGCYPVPPGPSPLFRQVGVHDFTFEACSGFTHVTPCRIAQPPKGGLCHKASARSVTRSSRSSATRVYRQLPGWNLPPLVNRAVGAHRIKWVRNTRGGVSKARREGASDLLGRQRCAGRLRGYRAIVNRCNCPGRRCGQTIRMSAIRWAGSLVNVRSIFQPCLRAVERTDWMMGKSLALGVSEFLCVRLVQSHPPLGGRL